MRNMIIFLVVVVALVVAMILLTREKPAPPAPVPTATPVRVAAPVKPRQPDSYQVLRPTPVSTFVPVEPPGQRVQPQAAPAPAAGATESKRAVMEAAAREAGVRIVAYSESGNSASVSVEWSSDIATQGADFIDALLKRGAIREFDSTGKPVRSIRNSRSYWRNSFSVKW